MAALFAGSADLFAALGRCPIDGANFVAAASYIATVGTVYPYCNSEISRCNHEISRCEREIPGVSNGPRPLSPDPFPLPMDLPTLTPFYFLLLHLLFIGPQTGLQLRQALKELGLKCSPSTFSRTMRAMVYECQVEQRRMCRPLGDKQVHEKRYEVTDYGVLTWQAAQKFYGHLAPPSADLVPLETERAELSVCDEKTRRRIRARRAKAEFRQIQKEDRHAEKRRRSAQP